MDTQWLSVKVHPHAKKDLLVCTGPGRFEAWVRAKPMDGQANTALQALLARALRISPQHIRLAKGAMGRHKVFKVTEATIAYGRS